MKIENELLLDFSDVLLKPKRSELASRKDVKLTRTFEFKYSREQITCCPIISANMTGIATPKMASTLSKFQMLCSTLKFDDSRELGRFASETRNDYLETYHIIDEDSAVVNPDLHVIPTIGLDYNLDNLDYDGATPWIMLDCANGYTSRFYSQIQKMRTHEATKRKIIIAGNVATGDATAQAILAGADAVKIGIGPGAVCTTREVAGVGIPQLSAIAECSDVAHGLGAHIIADGGITCPGDIAKAFGAGADFVMIGSLFAGHSEGLHSVDDEVISNESGQFIKFHGMSSKAAQEAGGGTMPEYRSSEGREVLMPYK